MVCVRAGRGKACFPSEDAVSLSYSVRLDTLCKVRDRSGHNVGAKWNRFRFAGTRSPSRKTPPSCERANHHGLGANLLRDMRAWRVEVTTSG